MIDWSRVPSSTWILEIFQWLYPQSSNVLDGGFHRSKSTGMNPMNVDHGARTRVDKSRASLCPFYSSAAFWWQKWKKNTRWEWNCCRFRNWTVFVVVVHLRCDLPLNFISHLLSLSMLSSICFKRTFDLCAKEGTLQSTNKSRISG